MPYADPESARISKRKYDRKHAAEINARRKARRQAVAARALAELRRRMRAAVEKCKADGVPISRSSLREHGGFRGHCGTMTGLINELIEDGTIEQKHLHSYRTARQDWREPAPSPRRDRDEEQVELPPLRHHAPETPPEHVKQKKPLIDVLRALYWIPTRRAWYRGTGT